MHRHMEVNLEVEVVPRMRNVPLRALRVRALVLQCQTRRRYRAGVWQYQLGHCLLCWERHVRLLSFERRCLERHVRLLSFERRCLFPTERILTPLDFRRDPRRQQLHLLKQVEVHQHVQVDVVRRNTRN